MLSGHPSHLRCHRSRFRSVTRPYEVIYSLQQLVWTHRDRLLFRWPHTAHNSSGGLIHTAYHSGGLIRLILACTDSYRWPTARPSLYRQATLQADLYLTPSTSYASTRSPVTCTTSLLPYMALPVRLPWHFTQIQLDFRGASAFHLFHLGFMQTVACVSCDISIIISHHFTIASFQFGAY